jgi:predicted nucleic-acid-binding protein
LIGLDTNVLVRLLVADDPVQAKKVDALVERAERADEPLFVSDVVLCETIWVLRQGYRFSRGEVCAVLVKLLNARQLTFSSTDCLRGALDAFAAGKGDFADYLLQELASDLGCRTVATFDRALLKEPGFSAP